MADDADLGHAVISTTENSNGESSGLLYQQADGRRLALGYQKEGIFVAVSEAAFFTPDALDPKAILEYKVVQLQRGASLVLSKPMAAAASNKTAATRKQVCFYSFPAAAKAAFSRLHIYFCFHRLNMGGEISRSLTLDLKISKKANTA